MIFHSPSLDQACRNRLPLLPFELTSGKFRDLLGPPSMAPFHQKLIPQCWFLAIRSTFNNRARNRGYFRWNAIYASAGLVHGWCGHVDAKCIGAIGHVILILYTALATLPHICFEKKILLKKKWYPFAWPHTRVYIHHLRRLEFSVFVLNFITSRIIWRGSCAKWSLWNILNSHATIIMHSDL
jgi:hypothetical protein